MERDENGFPEATQDFANALSELQTLRHSADYDPDASFTKEEVRAILAQAEVAIDGYLALDARQKKAFAALVLFPQR